MRRTNKRSFTVLLTAALLISTIPAPPQIAYADNTITNEMSIEENAEESDNTTQSESEVEETAKDADTDKSQTDDSQTDEALADKPVNDAASPIEQTKAPEETTPPPNSQNQEATALAVPENVSWGEDQETMCWDAVDNAGGYEIEVQITDTDSEKTKEVIKVPGEAPSADATDVDTTEADTSYDYSSFMEEGYSYKFRVKAVTSDKKLYTDSEYSSYSKTNDDLSSEEKTLPGELLEATALAVPKDISWGKDHGTMCWAAVDHADSYEIEVQITDADSKESLDVIEITNTDIADEDNADADTLDMIDLYTLDITDLDTADRADADNSYDYSSSMKEGCSYKFRVKAVTSDQALYEDSKYSSFSSKVEGTSSQEPQGEALATPEDISWGKDLGMMNWAAVDHADSYEVDVLITDTDLKESQDVIKVTKADIEETVSEDADTVDIDSADIETVDTIETDSEAADTTDADTADVEITYDYSSSMKAGYRYKFRVKAVTADKELYTDSEYSSFSMEAPSALKGRATTSPFIAVENARWVNKDGEALAKDNKDKGPFTWASWDAPTDDMISKGINGVAILFYKDGKAVGGTLCEGFTDGVPISKINQIVKFNGTGLYSFTAAFWTGAAAPAGKPSGAEVDATDLKYTYTAPDTLVPTPAGLKWNADGSVQWNEVDETKVPGLDDIQYNVAIYNVTEKYYIKDSLVADTSYDGHISAMKFRNVYNFTVRASGDGVQYGSSNVSDNSKLFYGNATSPKDLEWHDDGSIHWSYLCNIKGSDLQGKGWQGEYIINLYDMAAKDTSIGEWTTTDASWNKHIQKLETGHSYKFKVTVKLSDNSGESSFSESFTMTANSNTVNGKLDSLISDNNTSNADIDNLPISSTETQLLKDSLQATGAANSSLKKLEDIYASNDSGSACTVDVTGDVVNSSDVTVVGGTLNKATKLNIAAASSDSLPDYRTKVGMNISLEGTSTLKYPVSITMPAPSGMKAENVRIIHYKGNGSQETITPRVEGSDIEFVVSSFSTFVFYDITSAKRESSSRSGGGGGGGGGGGNVPKGINNMLPTPPTSAPVITGVWEKNDTGWYLKKADGSYPVNQWASINGAIYRFSAGGRMIEGWISLDNKWYYLKPDSGTMALGWVLVQDKWYHLNPDGTMATGWVSLGNKWYYMGSDGAMLTNTKTPDGYTVNKDGVRID